MAQCAAHPTVLIVLLFLGLAAVLLLTVPSEDVPRAPGFMYGIVLDAGSSHTSLFVYKWPADKQNGTGVVTQHSECHAKGGGISSYAGKEGAAGQSLVECLDQAVHDVPAHRHKVTPVYLGATAGMRLLEVSSPEHSSQILQEAGRKIQSYPFSYQGAAILSGQEEGAFGWVTVNYLLENFIKYGFVGRWLKSGRPTVGALDFGGASTQITFVTQERVEDEKDMMKLRLYGQEYSLYTHSFLCYGQDQVLKRLLAHIVKSQGYSVSVTHPCHPLDSSIRVNLASIFSSPCTAKYKPSSYKSQDSLLINGSGHYEQCVGNVSEIFSFDVCPFSHCSFNKVFQPNVTGSFMAFSAFFYIHSFLQRLTGITISTPAQMEEAAKTVCKMSFAQMLALDPDEASRLKDYCASSVFVKVLLLKGYRFDEKSFSSISFKKKAGDTSVGWALGYMLSLSNLLPSEKVCMWKALAPGVWESLIVLFVLLLVSVLVFIGLRACEWKKRGLNDGAI
ncbi:ectonucleoside triphosphate diphosphohydrolase 2-like [Syngnathoides biaculeatus]|uniref:ectonucleoside triphosphate diphosphohydrolase 2-like n=1 Tax=Syngnathoides biaculeatus TaxID=300417 RepID=UPI002ADDFCF1|nr:ectonucleoside triphosphate diphosphohydrolase 2-like [Syngnathoides biaculeatus]